jgi:hypothetical protein
MSKSSSPIKLGQKVFIVIGDEVVRTAVGKLESDGLYTFLNGYHSGIQHWFTFDEALKKLDGNLADKQEELLRRHKQLTQKRVSIKGLEYRSSVEAAPLKVVDLREDAFERARKRKHMSYPEVYYEPGEKVYVPVFAWTRVRSSYSRVYRPYRYFVLETVVTTVYVAFDGTPRYAFSTPYEVEQVFPAKKSSLKKMAALFEGHTDYVHFVSHEEEKAALEKMREEEGPPF